jgi:PAS domain S-box-containing protein
MDNSVTNIEGFKCEGAVDAQGREFLLLDRKQVLNVIWNMGESLIVLGPDADIWFVNRATEKMLGYDVLDLVGRPFRELAAADDKDFYARLKSMSAEGPIIEHRAEYLGKDGERIPVSLNCSTLNDESTGIFLGMVVVARDMRDILRLINELEESKAGLEDKVMERTAELENAALLASGLVHDFNNLLTAIAGNIELARLSAGNEERLFYRLDIVQRAVQRGAGLTKELLTIAKSGNPHKKKISIGTLVREAASLMLRIPPAAKEIVVPDGLWDVEADEGQLSQVLNNLLANAMQATFDDGTVSVECANIMIDDCAQWRVAAGRYVKVAVTDNGVGIDEETLRKIFDPYFTTKETGTGLGLATCYSIMKKHGGLITVESEPGVGTVFNLYLPAVVDEEIDI